MPGGSNVPWHISREELEKLRVAAMPGSNVPWHISREELEKLREARKNHKALEKAIDELIDKYL
uniref:Uncharacterized protein n=1 Tax=Lutzomyia longipalpis TaxID=7200 RepID=A0A1B0CQ80_LUTLO